MTNKLIKSWEQTIASPEWRVHPYEAAPGRSEAPGRKKLHGRYPRGLFMPGARNIHVEGATHCVEDVRRRVPLICCSNTLFVQRISFFWKMDQKVWTLERDKELNRHMAAGLSAGKIAALLHTTRSSVLGRIFRLRNKLSPAKLEQLKRQKIARKKAMAKKYAKATAEARRKAGPVQDKILAAVRADLAAGIDRDVVIKRAVAGGANCSALAEVFGLSRWRIYDIAGPGLRRPRWTDKQVELLMSMWPEHSGQEIADVLGTGRSAVLGKIWRMGLRKPESSASARGHSRAA